jgi:hypothetical protein
MIKSLSLLVRKAGMTHEQFIRDERRRPDIPPIGVEVDGIAETWYDDADAMARAAATPEMNAWQADGALFIGRIQSFITHEHVVIA